MTLLKRGVKLTLMKKLSLYVFLVLMFCNVGFADNFNYICSFETYYKTADSDVWNNKNMRFNIYNSGKILKMYDYEIKKHYKDLKIVINNSNEVVASEIFQDRIDTLVLNKNTLYAKYQNMYFDNEGGGEYSIGKCDLK